MKEYELTGYIQPKGQEEKGWQPIQEGYSFQLKDNIDPYTAINEMFNTILSHWLVIIKEKKKE